MTPTRRVVCLLIFFFWAAFSVLAGIHGCDEKNQNVVEDWGYSIQGTVTDSITAMPLADVAVTEGSLHMASTDTFWFFSQDTLMMTDSTGQYHFYRFGALRSEQAFQFTKTNYRTRRIHLESNVVVERAWENGSRDYRMDVELRQE